MSEPTDQNDQAIARLAQMGRRDREAILSFLSIEEQQETERALKTHNAELVLEEERQRRIDRQFLGYSPNLAALVEACEDGPTNGLTGMAASTIWEVHTDLIANHPPAVRNGWLGILDRVQDLLIVGRRTGA